MVVCQQCNIVADTVPRELNAILQVKPASDRHLRECDGGPWWFFDFSAPGSCSALKNATKKRVRVPSTSCSTTLHKSEVRFSYSLFPCFCGCCFFFLKLSLTGNRVCCIFLLFFTTFSVTRQTLWAPANQTV